MPRGRESVLGARAAEGGRSRSAAPRAKRHASGNVAPPSPTPAEPTPKDPLGSSSDDTTAAACDDALDAHFAHALLDGGVACDPDAVHPLLCGVEGVLGGDFGFPDKGYASMFGEETQEAACGAGNSPMTDACMGNAALDDALSFVAEVKARFQREPRTYAAFLQLLQRYRADVAGAAETAAAVAKLFRRNTDLADAFARFLPAGVTPTPRGARGAR